LDLCCGAGTNTIYLAEKDFEMTAIEISRTALKHAKEKAEQAKIKINVMIQSLVDLSFKENEFDFVFDMGCFHHVKIGDRPQFIKRGFCAF